MESAVFMAVSLISGAIRPNPHALGGAIRSDGWGCLSLLGSVNQVLKDQCDGDGERLPAGWISEDGYGFAAAGQIQTALIACGAQFSVCQARKGFCEIDGHFEGGL
jgi:hypothetical protein